MTGMKSVEGTPGYPGDLPTGPAAMPRVRRGAIGILSRDGLYLMIRRAPGVAKGGCWCFPGGHVEAGETSRRAIEREFAEELGLTVQAMDRLGAVRVGGRYILAVWRVGYLGGVLQPAEAEIADARWIAPDGLRSVRPGLPSNQHVFDMMGV